MRSFVLALGFALVAVAVSAAPLYQEDFESYAGSQAALQLAYATATTHCLLSSAEDHTTGTGWSLLDPGATTSDSEGAFAVSAEATALDPLNTVFWYYDTGTSAHIRSTLCIGSYAGNTWGSGTLNNYLALGNYNSTSATNYSRRNTFGGLSWQDTTIARSVGWHQMTIVANGTSAEFYIDSTFAGVDTYTEPPVSDGWNSIRYGLGLSSLTDGCYYDDVVVFNNTYVPVELSLFEGD